LKCYQLETEARGILKQQYYITKARLAMQPGSSEFWFLPTPLCTNGSLYTRSESESME
jgi:hypothetical protein